jgi:hypothetical protein
MLVELAAFNAAFGVVKQFVANGRDLGDCFQQITTITNAKEELKSRHQKKKNSFWGSLSGQSDQDIEEFMALEKITQAEKDLESMIKIYGRPGLWDDWVRFQAEARKRVGACPLWCQAIRYSGINHGLQFLCKSSNKTIWYS